MRRTCSSECGFHMGWPCSCGRSPRRSFQRHRPDLSRNASCRTRPLRRRRLRPPRPTRPHHGCRFLRRRLPQTRPHPCLRHPPRQTPALRWTRPSRAWSIRSSPAPPRSRARRATLPDEQLVSRRHRGVIEPALVSHGQRASTNARCRTRSAVCALRVRSTPGRIARRWLPNLLPEADRKPQVEALTANWSSGAPRSLSTPR